MRIDRRKALGLLGAGAAGPAAAYSPIAPVQHLVEDPSEFAWGVASGDPLAEAVVIWTRAATPGPVTWSVATDADMRKVVRHGVAQASPGRDNTIKVDVRGLKPATAYFFQFQNRARSPI